MWFRNFPGKRNFSKRGDQWMYDRYARIAQLNDEFRKTFLGGTVMVTSGVNALPDSEKNQILSLVKTFNQFTPDNDPYGEHDFGIIERGDQDDVFFKIDYYDKEMRYGSEDPSDPSKTARLMTIMLVTEY